MAIKRGPGNVARNHARNFIQKQAQARLDETVAAYNNQVENALAVDAVEIVLYSVNRLVGRPCSCSQTNIERAPGSDIAPVIPTMDDTNDDGFELGFQDDDIFGSSLSEKIMNDDVIADVSGGRDHGIVGVMEDERDGEGFEDGLMQGSINCGICYRTLRQPGYKPYGMQRNLLTHYDLELVDGYHIDSTSAPHALVKQHDDAYVIFRLPVPRYFVSVTFSIRDNLIVLRERPRRKDGAELTIDDLRQYAGHTIDIKIVSSQFTHVMFEFDLGIPKIKANIGGESTVLDYDRLQTMNDIPVVLGPSVAEVQEGDIVAIPERGLYLKIRDKERKITATQRRLEWVLTARVLQPTEPLRNISKGYKLR